MRPYLRAANVTWKGVDLADVKEMDFTAKESETYELRPGDLLLSEASGSPGEVGKPGQYRGQIEGCCFQNTLIRVRLPGGMSPDFYEHYFREQALNGYFSRGSRGVGIHHLGAAALAGWIVPVPPAAEQARIVTAIEEAFSKLDAGEAGLRTVRQLLERMRESILAAAVTGRLVPQDPADTPASELLADLGGETLVDPSLPAVPRGWVWAAVDSLAARSRHAIAIGPFGSNLKVSDYTDTGVPLVFVRHIRQRDFVRDVRFVDPSKARELRAHSVSAGDVLVTKMGSPPGDAAVFRSKIDAVITADCVKMTPGQGVSPDFLAVAISCGETRRRLLDIAGGVAQQKITLAGFRRLPVPVPPLAEQKRIADEVERQLSILVACERAVDEGTSRAGALRRSALKAAFSGQLAPQDLSEEPASVLLDSIRTENEANRSKNGVPMLRKKAQAS